MDSKEEFFNALYNADDTTEDEDEYEAVLKKSPKEVVKHVAATASVRTGGIRAVPSPSADAASTPGTETPSKRDNAMALERKGIITSHTVSSRRGRGGSKVTGKRKRDQPPVLMPLNQQIFRDKVFYFLPNDDIAKARSIRINKAREYGAVWVKEWSEAVTHVVVDQPLTYQDTISFLKLDRLPRHVVLVNERYPPDCISFKILLNPDRRMYHVRGHADAIAAAAAVAPGPADARPQEATAVGSSSSVSLAPKPDLQIAEQTRSLIRGSNEGAEEPTSGLDGNGLGHAAHLEVGKSGVISDSLAEQDLQIGSKPHDALDEAIAQAKTVEGLPVDSDEDENEVVVCEEGDEGSAISETEHERSAEYHKRLFTKSWQSGFSCMEKHDGTSKDDNPNVRTIEVLQKMADYYNRIQDHWRTTAYRKAIGALKKQKTKISTRSEARKIPFIGERLADKIEEIVYTNKLRRLENTDLEPNDEVLQTFMKIYGVGFAQATTWISQGHRTLEELGSVKLSRNQRIGLDHYQDFLTRIPRAEVEEHGRFVRTVLKDVSPLVQATIGGSFRRGAETSGDVDFLVTAPDMPLAALRTLVLADVVPRLFKLGYLRAGLAVTNTDSGSKWHGAACLPDASPATWRRVDFLIVPWEEWGAALIYFTGNDIFNRSIRLLASKKGMRLNQRGLYKNVMRGPGRARMTEGEVVEGRSEERIFELLGVPWRPPEHRIC